MQLRFQREPIQKNVWNPRILMNYGLVQHLEKCKAQCLYAQSFHLRWNKLRGIKPTFYIDGVFDLLQWLVVKVVWLKDFFAKSSLHST